MHALNKGALDETFMVGQIIDAIMISPREPLLV